MKKIINLMLLVLLLVFTGCTTDSDYIDTVKKMSFDTGETVEEHVILLIEAEEYCKTVELCEDEKDIKKLAQQAVIYPAALLQLLKEADFKYPKVGTLKWEIDGKTSSGKVIAASTEEYLVRISTTKNGDYISFDTGDFSIYNKKTNRKLNNTTNKNGRNILAILREIGYKEKQEVSNNTVNSEVSESLEEDHGGEKGKYDYIEISYDIHFYKNGRIKQLSAKDKGDTSIPIKIDYKDAPIDFNSLNAEVKSLEDNINTYIKEKNKSSNKDTDSYDDSLGILKNDIDKNSLYIYLDGLMLSKNLSKKEESTLEVLRNRVENIYYKL